VHVYTMINFAAERLVSHEDFPYCRQWGAYWEIQIQIQKIFHIPSFLAFPSCGGLVAKCKAFSVPKAMHHQLKSRTQHIIENMIWLTHLRLFIFPIYPQETYYFYKTVILFLDK